MALNERTLIERFFRKCGAQRADVPLGVGDDAALLDSPPGLQLVAAMDTLVSGNHFLPHFPADSIGHRALAVNLSDLAAMGADPAWALLALTLPSADEAWLEKFATGLGALARQHNVALVGGDTTRGPLCITVQLLGHAPRPPVMLRSGGRAGHVLFVSGTPGDAAAGLAIELGQLTAVGGEPSIAGRLGVSSVRRSDPSRPAMEGPPPETWLRDRFMFPSPRVELGKKLRAFASACIDVSDGLLGDAGRLAEASGCGVVIEHERLPVSPQLVACAGDERAREFTLTGGEAYELCFAVAPENVDRLLRDLPPGEWGYTRIGELVTTQGAVVTRNGTVMDFSHSGWDHFAS
jgi:thiamine-monophosphate kinase